MLQENSLCLKARNYHIGDPYLLYNCKGLGRDRMFEFNLGIFVLQTGESLVEGGHYASDEIESRVEELFAKWEELLEATDSRKLGLEQALSLVHFNRKVTYIHYGHHIHL